MLYRGVIARLTHNTPLIAWGNTEDRTTDMKQNYLRIPLSIQGHLSGMDLGMDQPNPIRTYQ